MPFTKQIWQEWGRQRLPGITGIPPRATLEQLPCSLPELPLRGPLSLPHPEHTSLLSLSHVLHQTPVAPSHLLLT